MARFDPGQDNKKFKRICGSTNFQQNRLNGSTHPNAASRHNKDTHKYYCEPFGGKCSISGHIKNPLSEIPIYQTGVLASWRKNGDYGEKDTQVRACAAGMMYIQYDTANQIFWPIFCTPALFFVRLLSHHQPLLVLYRYKHNLPSSVFLLCSQLSHKDLNECFITGTNEEQTGSCIVFQFIRQACPSMKVPRTPEGIITCSSR